MKPQEKWVPEHILCHTIIGSVSNFKDLDVCTRYACVPPEGYTYDTAPKCSLHISTKSSNLYTSDPSFDKKNCIICKNMNEETLVRAGCCGKWIHKSCFKHENHKCIGGPSLTGEQLVVHKENIRNLLRNLRIGYYHEIEEEEIMKEALEACRKQIKEQMSNHMELSRKAQKNYRLYLESADIDEIKAADEHWNSFLKALDKTFSFKYTSLNACWYCDRTFKSIN